MNVSPLFDFATGQPLDVGEHRRKRDALGEVLIASGLELTLPDGGLFLLARSPVEDERAFVEILARHGVIVLPGRLCGAPGFVRVSFSVEDEIITDSLGSWQAAVYEVLSETRARQLAASGPQGIDP